MFQHPADQPSKIKNPTVSGRWAHAKCEAKKLSLELAEIQGTRCRRHHTTKKNSTLKNNLAPQKWWLLFLLGWDVFRWLLVIFLRVASSVQLLLFLDICGPFGSWKTDENFNPEMAAPKLWKKSRETSEQSSNKTHQWYFMKYWLLDRDP